MKCGRKNDLTLRIRCKVRKELLHDLGKDAWQIESESSLHWTEGYPQPDKLQLSQRFKQTAEIARWLLRKIKEAVSFLRIDRKTRLKSLIEPQPSTRLVAKATKRDEPAVLN